MNGTIDIQHWVRGLDAPSIDVEYGDATYRTLQTNTKERVTLNYHRVPLEAFENVPVEARDIGKDGDTTWLKNLEIGDLKLSMFLHRDAYEEFEDGLVEVDA